MKLDALHIAVLAVVVLVVWHAVSHKPSAAAHDDVGVGKDPSLGQAGQLGAPPPYVPSQNFATYNPQCLVCA